VFAGARLSLGSFAWTSPGCNPGGLLRGAGSLRGHSGEPHGRIGEPVEALPARRVRPGASRARSAGPEWRQRMSTDEAKKACRQRAPTCGRPHADGKAHRNLSTFPIRGLNAARSCAALFALSFDLLALVPSVTAAIRG